MVARTDSEAEDMAQETSQGMKGKLLGRSMARPLLKRRLFMQRSGSPQSHGNDSLPFGTPAAKTSN